MAEDRKENSRLRRKHYSDKDPSTDPKVTDKRKDKGVHYNDQGKLVDKDGDWIYGKKYRDENGRLTSDFPGGPGRKKNNLVEKMKRAAQAVLKEDQLEQLMMKCYNKAMEGDLKAAKLVLDRFYGKPSQSIKMQNLSKQQLEISFKEANIKEVESKEKED